LYSRKCVTPDAVIDLENWGADAVKIGIGPGSACTTYNATGFGSRYIQSSIIEECARVSKTIIIADGGIVSYGDISKALVMGATMVMIGGMFSGLTDSPGPSVTLDGKIYKEFWGSASESSTTQQGTPKIKHIEGTKKLMPQKHHSMLEEMNLITQSLQSAISYGGGNDLSCFKSVKYIKF